MAWRLSTEALARGSARRPWRTIGAWILALVIGGFLFGTFLQDALTTEADFTNNPESRQAQELIEERLRGPERATELVIVRSETLTVDDPAFRAFVEDLRGDVLSLGPGVVEQATDVYQSGDPTLVSDDRHTTLLPVIMAGTVEQATENVEQLHDVTIDPERPGDFQVLQGGVATLEKDFTELAERDLQTGEVFGIPVALGVLVAVFGAVVAAIMPIVLALGAIAVALGIVALMGQAFDFSYFVVNMVTMLGLAVGIDYSLFIISRYREERAAGRERIEAIATAGATASRAVFWSGLTVILALIGMFLNPTTIFRSLATGAILVVLASMAASLTLLPAVLRLLGDRVNALHIPLVRRRAEVAANGGGFWNWLTRSVMRRPVVSLAVAAGLLVAAAVSVFDMRTGLAGVGTMPDDTRSKRAFVVLVQEFAGGLAQPVEIVVDGEVASPQVRAGIGRLQASLAEDPAFGPGRVEANLAGDLAVLSVPLVGDPSSDESVDAIRRLRSDYVPEAFTGAPAEVLVGGQPAMSVDFFDITDSTTPVVFLFVLGLSFLLLMVVFRSLVVPLKAIVMNLLSVGAAYGLIVLVFQKGIGNELFGFRQVEVIEAWLPLFLFSVLFGLSMDYHVFLLSRIRERFDQTGDNAEAVAFGLRSTAGIITGAALIMVAVFGAFAAGELVPLQQMGFGLAVAVLLDATIVRSILVPSTMQLLGNRNWYLPRWLRWLPQVRVERAERPKVPAPVGREVVASGAPE